MKTKFLLAAPVLAVFAVPAAAQTGSTESAADRAADQRLATEKSEMRDAYKSGDKKKIAAERGELGQAYRSDLKTDHVDTHSAGFTDQRADHQLSAAQKRTRMAYKSGDPKRIAAERRKLGQAYGADIKADQRTGEPATTDRDPH